MKITHKIGLLTFFLIAILSSTTSAITFYNLTMNTSVSNTSVTFSVLATCDAAQLESRNITLTNCTVGSASYATLFFDELNHNNDTLTLYSPPVIRTLVNGTDLGSQNLNYNEGFNTTGAGSSPWTTVSQYHGGYDVVNVGTTAPDANLRMRATSANAVLDAYTDLSNTSIINNITFYINLSNPMATQYLTITDSSGVNYLKISFGTGSNPVSVTCSNETSASSVGTLALNTRTRYDIQINNTGDGRVYVLKNGVDQGGSCYTSSNIGSATRISLKGTSDGGSASGTVYFDELSIYTRQPYNPLLNFTTDTAANNTVIVTGQTFEINAMTYSSGLIGGSPTITLSVNYPNGTVAYNTTSSQPTNYSRIITGLSAGTYYFNATMDNTTHYGISTTRTLIVSSLDTQGINTPSNTQQVSNSTIYISWNATITNASFSNISNYNITLLNYDGTTNQTINANVATNTSYTWNVPTDITTGSYYIKVYSYDTLGNSVSEQNLFHYIKPTLAYTNPALETQSVIFTINLTTAELELNITTFNGTLQFNGTTYNLTRTNTSTYYTGTVNATMPNITTTSLVLNFTWTLNINGINHTFTNNITITKLSPVVFTNGTCTPGLSTAMYFNSKDEETLLAIPINISYNFQIGIGNNQYTPSYGNISNTYDMSICINSTQAPTWTVGYGEIQYVSTSYESRRYYIFNNTHLTSTTTNITLYDLISTHSTSFQVTAQTQTSGAAYTNKYLALIRWYPDLNSYLIVDMGLTDNDGSTVVHSVVENVDYRFALYELDGTLIALKDPVRMVCLTTPCAYTIAIAGEDVDFDNLINLQYSLTYNTTTGEWLLLYNDPSQSTTNINLTIYKDQGNSVYSICNSNLATYTGAVSCTTPLYANAKLRAVVARSASPQVPLLVKVVELTDSAMQSGFGLFLSLIIIIPLTMLMVLVSPVFAVVGVVVGAGMAYVLGSINYLIISGFAVLAFITLYFMGKTNR